MIISISNTLQVTQIFQVLLILALLVSIRPKKITGFSVDLTQELKGVAILMVVFSHIAYFLVSDPSFLHPLSIAAGVGVNLFLFLSGYGLVYSALSKKLSIGQFYKKRLLKLYLPLWLSLGFILILDYVVAGKSYGLFYTLQSFLGIFNHANLYTDINSPLWYFSLIVFYYLLFPLLFWRKYPWLSALGLYLAGYFIIKLEPSFLDNVLHLYKVHILAFPLGVLFGALVVKYSGSWFEKKWNRFKVSLRGTKKIKTFKQPVSETSGANILAKYKGSVGHYFVCVLLLGLIIYSLFYSHVGEMAWLEDVASMFSVALIILLFFVKKFEIRLLYWFGFYSFEIYLFHWPLMYRFDIFYRFVPAWLATLLYLALFLGLGWLMRFVIDRLRPIKPRI